MNERDLFFAVWGLVDTNHTDEEIIATLARQRKGTSLIRKAITLARMMPNHRLLPKRDRRSKPKPFRKEGRGPWPRLTVRKS